MTLFWIKLGLLIFAWWLDKQDDNHPLIQLLTAARDRQALIKIAKHKNTVEHVESIVAGIGSERVGELITGVTKEFMEKRD